MNVLGVPRLLDHLGFEEREKILPKVQDMHILVDDMEARIHELERECPSEWSPYKKSLDDAHVDMRAKYDETMAHVGKATPVSVAG
jgi:hypothetical protein